MYFIKITTSIAFCLYLIDIYVQNDILVFCSQEKAFMCSIRGDLQRRSCLFISSTATSPVLSGSWICVSGRYHSDISNSTKKRWLHKDTVLSVGKDWNEFALLPEILALCTLAKQINVPDNPNHSLLIIYDTNCVPQGFYRIHQKQVVFFLFGFMPLNQLQSLLHLRLILYKKNFCDLP